MKYLLDTNTCIYYLNASHPKVVEHILRLGPAPLAVSSLTVAELYFGAARSARPEANRRRVAIFASELANLSFDSECAAHFGRVKAAAVESGRPVPDFDLAIAATALAQGRTVVTNDRHFALISGLALENWLAP